MKNEEQARQTHLEYLKVSKEITDALCKISSKKGGKKIDVLNNDKIIKYLREDVDNRYSERIQLTKDIRKKMRYVEKREKINNDDKELLKVLKDLYSIYGLGVEILERNLKKDNNQVEK